MNRQQDFLQRVMQRAVRVGRNPATLNALIANAVKNVKIDDAFSTKDILRLGRRFRSLEPDKVEMIDIPQTKMSGKNDGKRLRTFFSRKNPFAKLTADQKHVEKPSKTCSKVFFLGKIL